jgi:pimeloyl-ACP methyl ester carboxylesterase
MRPKEPFTFWINKQNDSSMQPFLINYSEDKIDELNRRLDATRWPAMPFATGWTSGTNDHVLRDLVRYWRNEYDWFKEQKRLNRLNHLRGPVEGEQLHCVLYKGSGGGQRPPLLLLHGWPSSFVEFLEAAEILVSGGNGKPGFTLVVPSLPGFVFSEAPRAPGMHVGRIAERIHGLMQELGFKHYGITGGDWGAIIATALARQYPEAVVGLHINFVHPASPPPAGEIPSKEEKDYIAFHKKFQLEETGYSQIQRTRPQTLAYAQQDSPVGLLAWFLEKFWAWSDHGDDLWQTFTKDQLLTNVMLYWLPGCVLSSARIYYETFFNMPKGQRAEPIEVPIAYSRFPAEPWSPPRQMVERQYNLIHYSEPSKGGHFPALEQPAIWAEDVATFFSDVNEITNIKSR